MNTRVTEQSISDLMNFDPFQSDQSGTVTPAPTPDPSAEKSGTGAPAKPGETTPATPAPKPGEQTPPATPPASPDPKPATPPGQSTEALAAQVQTLREMIPQMMQQQQPRAPETPAADKPHFNFQLPPQLTSALRSEDPNEASAAMGILVNGMANAIRNDYMKVVQESVLPQVVQIAQAQIAQHYEQQRVIDDFYGSYPEFKQPALMPIVANTAMQTAQQMGATSWTPALKEAIANNLRAMFPGLQPQQKAPPQPAPPPAQRPYVPNGGARLAPATADANADAMAGVLDSVGIKL